MGLANGVTVLGIVALSDMIWEKSLVLLVFGPGLFGITNQEGCCTRFGVGVDTGQG